MKWNISGSFTTRDLLGAYVLPHRIEGGTRWSELSKNKNQSIQWDNLAEINKHLAMKQLTGALSIHSVPFELSRTVGNYCLHVQTHCLGEETSSTLSERVCNTQVYEDVCSHVIYMTSIHRHFSVINTLGLRRGWYSAQGYPAELLRFRPGSFWFLFGSRLLFLVPNGKLFSWSQLYLVSSWIILNILLFPFFETVEGLNQKEHICCGYKSRPACRAVTPQLSSIYPFLAAQDRIS